MFFDVFQQAEQESEVKSQKKWLVAEISDLLSLFVRDCTQPLPPTSSSLLSMQPLSKLPQSQNSQGKKKVDWDDRAPWEGTSMSVEQGRDLDEGLEPSFGFQTPFKKGTCFFDSSADGPSSAYFSTPGSMFTPDITVGLGTPSRTELGQNVRDYSANQGTEAFAMTKRTANTAQAITTTSTSLEAAIPFQQTATTGPLVSLLTEAAATILQGVGDPHIQEEEEAVHPIMVGEEVVTEEVEVIPQVMGGEEAIPLRYPKPTTLPMGAEEEAVTQEAVADHRRITSLGHLPLMVTCPHLLKRN